MKRKIIFYKFTPLTFKIYNDLCISDLLSNGYIVEYWNIMDLYGLNLLNVEDYRPQGLLIRQLDSYSDFENLVKSNLDALYISLIACNLKHIKILKIFTKYDCKTAFWGPDPTPIEIKGVLKKIKNITIKNIKTKIVRLYLNLMFKYNRLHFFDNIFSVGEFGYMSLALGSSVSKYLSESKILNIHSSDYNTYNFQNHKQLIHGDYIVFIDEYYPFHPDALILGLKQVPEKEYYNQLNAAFDLIEQKYNMKIVIAAHPKAELYKKKNFFNGRKIYFNSTSQLIKYAKFTISHDSTAISQAIMSYKPIILFNSSLFEQIIPANFYFINLFSRQLGVKEYFMDKNNIQDLNDFSISLSDFQLHCYANYIKKYCTLIEGEKSNNELILYYLNTIFKC